MNPWVFWLGGDTTFGALAIGERFAFPKGDLEMVKTSSTGYADPRGFKWSTGKGTAVKIVLPKEVV